MHTTSAGQLWLSARIEDTGSASMRRNNSGYSKCFAKPSGSERPEGTDWDWPLAANLRLMGAIHGNSSPARLYLRFEIPIEREMPQWPSRTSLAR